MLSGLAAIFLWFFPQMPRTAKFFHDAFDLLPDLAAIFLALLLGGLGVALVFLPEELKRLEGKRKARLIIAWSLVGIAVLFGAGGVISNAVQKQEDKDAAQEQSKASQDQMGKMLDELKLATTNEELLKAQLAQLSRETPKIGPRPEVKLRFVYPTEPALLLFNDSSGTAQQIKWAVDLWNAATPDRLNPLPIPTSTFDFLRSGGYGGPQNLFDGNGIPSLIKTGDVLYGSASVLCPDCIRGHSYYVYITMGQGGWFHEVKSATHGGPLIPARFTREDLAAYLQSILSVPESEREPITNPATIPFPK